MADEETKPEEEVKPEEAKPEEKPEEQEKKNKVSARQRINELTRARGDRDRIIEEKDRRIAELEKGQRIEKKPQEDDFDTFDDYSKQNDRYSRQQQDDKQTEIDRLADQKVAQRAAEARQLERGEIWAGHKSKGIKKYENFQDSEDYVVAVANHYRNPGIQELILDAEDPAAIVDYLGSNHKEAEKLAQVSLVSAARTISVLETQLKPSKEKDKLPPPATKPGSGSSGFDPYTATQAEYNAHYNR